MSLDYIAIDFETANESPRSAISVGLVRFENGVKTDSFYTLLQPADYKYRENPSAYFLPRFIKIHGIQSDEVKDAPFFFHLQGKELKPWLETLPLVAHNAKFDMGILKAILDYSVSCPHIRYFDSLWLSRRVWPQFENHKLPTLASKFGIVYDAHNALADAENCGKIVALAADELLKQGKIQGEVTLDKVLKASGEWMKKIEPPKIAR